MSNVIFFYTPPKIGEAKWNDDLTEMSAPVQFTHKKIEFIGLSNAMDLNKYQEMITLRFKINDQVHLVSTGIGNDQYEMDTIELVAFLTNRFTTHITLIDHDLAVHSDAIYQFLLEKISKAAAPPPPPLGGFYSGIVEHPAPEMVNSPKKDSVEATSQLLPGVGEKVFYPCSCHERSNTIRAQDTIWTIVQHLNDYHRWSREKIADWLDDLHDHGQVNIEFDPWDEGEPKEKTELPESWYAKYETPYVEKSVEAKQAVIFSISLDKDKVADSFSKVNSLDEWKSLGYINELEWSKEPENMEETK